MWHPAIPSLSSGSACPFFPFSTCFRSGLFRSFSHRLLGWDGVPVVRHTPTHTTLETDTVRNRGTCGTPTRPTPPHHGVWNDSRMQPRLLRSGNPPARHLHLPKRRQKSLLPGPSGRRSTHRLASQRLGTRLAGREDGRRTTMAYDPRFASGTRWTQVLWKTTIAISCRRSVRSLRGHRCVRGVARRVITSSPWNRVGNEIVVLDRRNGIDEDVERCAKTP